MSPVVSAKEAAAGSQDILLAIRHLRPPRNRFRNNKSNEDLYILDEQKSPKHNACDILRGLCSRSGVFYEMLPGKSDAEASASVDSSPNAISKSALSKTIVSNAKRLSYLSALVKLLSNDETRQNIGFNTEELLCCLRVNLVHEATQVRAGTLRAVRYVLKTEADIVAFNALRLPYLVTRSLDVVLHNEMERVQALRVVRRVIRLAAHLCEQSIVRALIAVPGASPDDRDRMLRAYLAALCELGILNPQLFIHTGGVTAITRAILDCQTPRIAESLCGVLLFLLNDPKTRLPAKVDLRCLAAPYCDFHYRHGWMDKNRDEREMRFTCSRLSLLSILRSWPGLLHFCDPLNESGLRAIVDVLYLNQLEVRKAILDLLYELLGLPQPDWTDELSVALSAVDPSDFQDSWRLNEGFVAAEGRSILPHLSATGPNLAELHLALLLYCFLEVGLLDALAEVMISSDTFISVRATVLLGQLLHLVHLLLPPETCNISPALPSLLSKASATHPQALAAVAALQNLNSLLKSRPASHSLFLDHILQYCGPSQDPLVTNVDDFQYKQTLKRNDTLRSSTRFQNEPLDLLNDEDYEKEIAQRRSFGSRSEYMKKNESVLIKSKSAGSKTSAVVSKVVKTKKLLNFFEKDNDTLIQNSLVFQDKVGNRWDWSIIRAILKNSPWNAEKALFVKRLVIYFKPSSNRFSHTDLQQNNPLHTRYQAIAALELVTYLLGLQDAEGVKLLMILFTDIRSQIAKITVGKSVHDCLFSPQHMATTMCQMYFLLVGRLCSTQEGLKIFLDTGLKDCLCSLATSTHHNCYVKLIISSLDYSLNSYPRQILAHTLRCSLESSRLYATQFLNVLLRARQKANDMNNKLYGNVENVTNSGDDDDDSGMWTLASETESCSEMDTWILEMLVKQARDESKAVSLCALAILDEACNVKTYLDKLVNMKPRVKDLGDKGYLLWIRFASTSAGYTTLANAGYVHRQIRYWATQYNYRYTRIVEGDVHDCLTLLQRSEDGRYSRRHSSVRSVSCRGVPLPPHLYGQLALHHDGIAMLFQYGDLPRMLSRVKQGACSSEQEIMDLKSALWACGHVATSTEGIELIIGNKPIHDCFFSHTINLAQTCQVFSIRGTAFYVLGLMGCSYHGANLLHELGWLAVRHNRHERWPIIQEEKWLTKSDSEHQIFQNLMQMSTRTDNNLATDTEMSETSVKTEQSVATESSSETLKTQPGKPSTSLSADCSIMEMSEDLDKFNVSIDSVGNEKTEECDKLKRLNCQMLPHCVCPPTSKFHQRSWSESKTLEKLRSLEESGEATRVDKQITTITENKLFTGGGGRFNSYDLWQEGRNRNYSESSTSGVSSCDSVLGKYVINDRILTLSPIPSSSSLSAMKSTIQSRRKSESTRRISLHSCTGLEVASSPPSQRDLFGYATLRLLSRHRRPTYSDASMDKIGSFLDPEVRKPIFASLRVKNKSTDAKHTLSILKNDWKPIGAVSDTKSSDTSQYLEPEKHAEILNTISADIYHRKSQHCHAMPPGPCYIGISMPKCLLDIFPRKSAYTSEESSDGNYMTGDDSLAYDCDNQNQELGVKRNDDSNFNSSFSDLSTGNEMKPMNKSKSKTRDRMLKHDLLMCLYCSKVKIVSEVKKVSDLREAFFAGLDSPKPSGSGSNKSGTFGKSPARTNSLTYVSFDVSCGSPTSLDSNLSKLSDSNPTVVCEILKHSERMGNPILHKQSKQVLLSLKQKYPEAFQSVCLYSEICKILSQNTYRLNARRFVQELFLDLNFDMFYLEPQQIIQNKLTEISNQ